MRQVVGARDKFEKLKKASEDNGTSVFCFLLHNQREKKSSLIIKVLNARSIIFIGRCRLVINIERIISRFSLKINEIGPEKISE